MRKLILLLFVLVIGITGSAYAVPVIWSENSHTYDFITTNISWHDAKTQTESLGGYLATIASAEENEFIRSNFYTGQSSNFAWIGGYQYDALNEPAGHWRWVTEEPWSYTNWGGIEPNNKQENEDYAMYNIGLSFRSINPGYWADAVYTPSGDDPVIGYLVEYNATAPIPEPTAVSLLGLGLLGLVFRKKKLA